MSVRPALAVVALALAFGAWAAAPATPTPPGTYCTAIPIDVSQNEEKLKATRLPDGWVAVGGTNGSTADGYGGRPMVVACATFP